MPESDKPFQFSHATKEGTQWIEGPWRVVGPSFEMLLLDRTEAALLTKKLNDMVAQRWWK